MHGSLNEINGSYIHGRSTVLGHLFLLHAFPSHLRSDHEMNKLSRFTKKPYMNLLQLDCEFRVGISPKPQKEIQLK